MYVPRHIDFESRTNELLRSCRSELEPSRKASGRETCHARYGSLECYCTCMLSNFLVHDPPGLCLRLSQLIGSTLALEYMRAGTHFSLRSTRLSPNTNIQNMLHRWDQLLLSSISCLLDFS
jgi:hypothetical protein